jgi:DNA-3-methyladenine glycosylase II
MNRMTFTERFTILASAPFNFDLTAQIFGNGDRQIRTYANGKFSQAFRVNSNLLLVKVASIGTIEQPKTEVSLKSIKPITSQEKTKAEALVKFIFNLDFDLSAFYKETKNEPIMRKITQHLYGLKSPTTPTVFEALVDSVVEQQISIRVAHTIEERLVKKFGETLTVDGETYFAYPTPQSMAVANVNEIQNCGLTKRKAEYIYNAAKLIVDGKLDLERLKSYKIAEQIVSELDEIRGIGAWTAELTMLRGMQKLDALPADDLGIRRVISKYYCNGKPINANEARKIARTWGKWKGLAAFYLITAEIKGIIV